jgi:hypothetical protein
VAAGDASLSGTGTVNSNNVLCPSVSDGTVAAKMARQARNASKSCFK